MARKLVAALLAVSTMAGCTGGIGTVDDEDGPAEDVDIRIVERFADSAEPVTRTFEIPEDSGPYELRLTIESEDGSGPCVAVDAKIALDDPDGTRFEQIETMGTVNGMGESCGASTTDGDAELEPGTWTARFSGNGTARGVVSVQN